jgi:hypothetical protein
MDDALKFLVGQLKAAQHHKPQNDDPDDNLQRHRTMEALSSVATYLREAGVKRKLYAPLLDLLGALGDASMGRHNPLTAPIPHKLGSPKTPIFARNRMVTASAVVTLWMQYAKWSGEKAYDEAAAAIHVTPKELKNYRKSLTRGVSLAPREDVELYWWCIQTARGYATQHAEQYGGGAVPGLGMFASAVEKLGYSALSVASSVSPKV